MGTVAGESLERNRVFDQSSLQILLSRGIELFNSAIEKCQLFETQTTKVWQLVNQVPGEAKDAALASFCLSLIASTAFRTDEYEKMEVMLYTYINKLLDNIYSSDLLAAEAVNEIAECVTEIGSMADDLKGLLAGGALSIGINEYTQVLKGFQGKWDGVKVDFDSKMELATTALKGMQSLCEYSDDPVNLSTGNFVYQKTDLVIEGRHKLCFSRFYNAMDVRKGSLGRGWRHSFEECLIFREEEVLFIGTDGREEEFEKAGKYTYRSKVTGKRSLHTTKGGFRYLDGKGNLYTWDRKGRIIDKLPAGGCHIRYRYDEEGKLVEVAADTGDSFRFHYENGCLSKVTDHADRYVCYEYVKNKLVKVTGPCGDTTEYTYEKCGRIETVRNEEGVVTVRNEYDRNRRIIRQVFPDGGTAAYEYKDSRNQVIFTQPNGNRKIYASDEKMRHTATIHENGMECYAYDEEDRCTAYTDRNGNQTKYQYDERGNITQICNPLGETQSMEYNLYGRMTQITYADGTRKQAVYDERGRLTECVDEAGARTRISYGKEEKAVRVELPDGSTGKVSYDEKENVREISFPDGRAFSYEYDSLNRVICSRDGNGNATVYQYDAGNRLTILTNPEGYTRCYTYNAKGDIIKRKNFDGGILEVAYGKNGKPEKVTDEEGGTTSYIYDLMGNLSSVIYPEGGRAEFRYNRQNLPEWEKHPDGCERQLFYDKQGNCVREVDEGGRELLHEYDALNRLSLTRLPEGRELRYRYDKRGRLIRTQDNRGWGEERRYDACGRLLSVVNYTGERTEYSYNILGLLTCRRTPECTVTYGYGEGGVLKSIKENGRPEVSYAYDRAGNVTEIRYQDSLVLRYQYNASNRPERIFRDGEEWMTFFYDPMGRVTGVKEWGELIRECRYSGTGKLLYVWERGSSPVSCSYDKEGRLTCLSWEEEEQRRSLQYSYDPMGRLTEAVDSLGFAEHYAYDCYGQLCSFTDRDGNETVYRRSPEGQLLSCIYSDGKRVEMSYDALDRLRQVQDLTGSMEIRYGANGMPHAVTGQDGEQICYFWREDRRLQALAFGDGSRVDYAYLPDGRLKEILLGQEKIRYQYDNRGSLAGKEYPGGISQQFFYDREGRMTGFRIRDREGMLEERQFTYSREGLRTGTDIRRRQGKDQRYAYTYDPAGRLLEVYLDGKPHQAYGYDGCGNRRIRKGAGEETCYFYDRNGYLIREETPGGKLEHRYDKSGRRIGSSMAGGGEKSYSYDASGNLISYRNGIVEDHRYLWNGLGQLAGEEAVLEGQIEKRKYYRDILRKEQTLLGTADSGGIRHYWYDYESRTVAAGSSQEKSWFYITDEAGSPLYITDTAGRILEEHIYEAFGEESGNADSFQIIGFHGLSRGEDGHYRAGKRLYDPAGGCFLSEDVVKGNRHEPVSLNLYAYGRNNPLRYEDRTGETPALLETAADLAEKYLGQTGTYLVEAGKAVYATGSYVWNGVTSAFRQTCQPGEGGARETRYAECGVVFTEEQILTIAGYPGGSELIAGTLPEDCFLLNTRQYRETAGNIERESLSDVLWDYADALAELYMDGWKDGKSLFELHHEEADLTGEMIDAAFESREAQSCLEWESNTPMVKFFMDTVGGVRYMLAGYDYEEAVYLAESNRAENRKNMSEGFVNFFKELGYTATDPVAWKEGGKAALSWAEENLKPENLSPEKVLLMTNPLWQAIQTTKTGLNSIGQTMESYFFGEDEEAYRKIGNDMGAEVFFAILGAAAGQAKGAKAADFDAGDFRQSGGRVPVTDTVDDELTKFYDDIFDAQRKPCREYEDFLDDLQTLADDDIIEDGIDVLDDVAEEAIESGKYSDLGNMSFEDGKRYSSWSSLREEGLSYEQVEKIKDIPKGQKPSPETYLSNDYINNHLQSFKESGAVKVMPNEPTGTIGGKGGTFVMSGDELNEIIQYADGDVSKIETILGLEQGYLGENPVVVSIEDTSSIRIPSGNELGAWPEYWEPGGYTSGGIKEAVVNPAVEGTYTYKHLFE